MNKASESFVSLAVRMLLFGFDFHYKYLDSGHTRPPVLKKGLGLFHFFGLKLRILQKLLKMFRNAKHLCFNAGSDHCTMIDTRIDTIGFISWLPDDYSITALQEFFPYYAKNGQKSQCFTIYIMNINSGKQNIASFISPTKRTIKSIDRCLRIHEHQILEFL